KKKCINIYRTVSSKRSEIRINNTWGTYFRRVVVNELLLLLLFANIKIMETDQAVPISIDDYTNPKSRIEI
ncbi:MAG: hypothetical protein ACI90V_000466, partial [Bacillariaceae sp.]